MSVGSSSFRSEPWMVLLSNPPSRNITSLSDIVIIDGHGVGVWGGAPQGKKLFEVDTQGEKGRHPHLDTPKVKKKLGKLTPGVSTFSHFYFAKSPPDGRADG